MNTENNFEQNVLEMLNSEDPSLKTEALFNLTFEEVDKNVVKAVIRLILEDDKSVKMLLQIFLFKIITHLYHMKYLILSVRQKFL